MGNVADHPSLETLMASPAGKLMLAFKDYVDTACGKCKHIKYLPGRVSLQRDGADTGED